MRFAGPVRKELGVRTLFNCLGPLANPAGATHQLLGAFSDALRPRLAQALADLGTQRAWVVWGHDGLDEVSPYGPTSVTQVHHGVLTELQITPEDFGLPLSAPGAAAGGAVEHNAQVLRAVLAGEPHAARNAFLLNAAAALVVALELPPRAALQRAAAAVDSGAASATLERWRASVVRVSTPS
jgi:anthranilate phosphoribosyltransferase